MENETRRGYYETPRFFEIQDSYGAPQCGCAVTRFEEWHELEEYVDSNSDVAERIEDGYAIIRECAGLYYTLWFDDEPEIFLQDELAYYFCKFVDRAIYPTFADWTFDMTRSGILYTHN